MLTSPPCSRSCQHGEAALEYSSPLSRNKRQMIPYTLPNPPQNFPNCTTHTPQVFLTTLSPFTAPKQHLRQSPVPALHTPSATMTKRQPEDLATSDKLRSLVDAVPDDASPNDLREMIEFLRGILKGAERKQRAKVSPFMWHMWAYASDSCAGRNSGVQPWVIAGHS